MATLEDEPVGRNTDFGVIRRALSVRSRSDRTLSRPAARRSKNHGAVTPRTGGRHNVGKQDPHAHPARFVTMFHVTHEGLGSKIELTHNRQWGEHCRKEALAHAAQVDRHLSDGRSWMLGGDEPTFADITLCTAIAFSKFPANATPLDERFEHLDAIWQRWKTRPSFQRSYADGNSGLAELAHLHKI